MNETENISVPEIVPAIQPFSRTQVSLERGKLPPQDLNLEEAILGAMLIDKKGVDDVIDILNPEVFYKSNINLSIKLSLNFSTNRKLSTCLRWQNNFAKMAIWRRWEESFTLLISPNEYHHLLTWNFHARIILQKFIKRKLIEISSEIIEDAYDDTRDVFDRWTVLSRNSMK